MPNTPRTIYYHKEIAPCKDCRERKMRCHSQCEKYSKWKRDNRDSRGSLLNYYRADRNIEDYEITRCTRNKKKYKR